MRNYIQGESFLDASSPHTQVCLTVTESSQVAEARRRAVALAQGVGFNETGTGKVALVVTELATNLLKHATRGGALVLRAVPPSGTGGIEILALDTAPGMANVAACLRDGYSTTGSPGTGLGALLRLSSLCEIHSLLGKGTAVLVRLQPQGMGARQPPTVRCPPATIGAVCLPCAGETVCGDAWAVDQRAGRVLIMVADGLGHGPLAAEAAQEAVPGPSDPGASSPAGGYPYSPTGHPWGRRGGGRDRPNTTGCVFRGGWEYCRYHSEVYGSVRPRFPWRDCWTHGA
jgi:anti-sigma regulatory factor (Ser/Thr protein kinase)